MANMNEQLAKGAEYTRNAGIGLLGVSLFIPGLTMPSLLVIGGGEFVRHNRTEAAKKGGGIFP